MISKSIEALNLANPQHQHAILRQIFRYLLGIGSTMELHQVAKEYGIKDEIEEIRNTLLSKSAYATSIFWRAFKLWTVGSPASVIQKEFKVSEDTLKLAIKVLTAADVIEIQHVLRKRSHKKLSEAVLLQLLKETQPLCNKLAYQMRFLYKYDGGLSHEGFRSDFMMEALRVIRHYDYTEDYIHLKNRVVRSIYNYWKRMIEFYTAKKRRRLVRVEGGNEYSLEVLSLDYAQSLNSEDPDYFDLHSMIDAKNANPEQDLVERDFVEKLTQEIPHKISLFVDTVFGREYSSGFISWVQENYDKHPDEASDFYLRSYAAKYLSISKEELKKLGMLVVDLGEGRANERRDFYSKDKRGASAG